MSGEHVADVEAATRRAEELLSASDFAGARTLLEDMLVVGEDGELLTRLAAARRALGEVPAAVGSLERAYRWFLDEEEHAAAGVAACSLADLELTHSGASAVASGWLARARNHLDFEPDHPGHVYLEALCAYRAMAYEKDPLRARTFAEAALAHGRRLGDRTAELMGKGVRGLHRCCAGAVGGRRRVSGRGHGCGARR